MTLLTMLLLKPFNILSAKKGFVAASQSLKNQTYFAQKSLFYSLDTKLPSSTITRCKMAETPLVWIDCEMTGLDLSKDKIIEIAAIVTDKHLNIIAEGPNLVIHQPAEIIDNMDDWCKKHHGDAGLTAAVLSSKLTIGEAEEQMLEFVKKHLPLPKIGIIAGNSVHVDRQFLSIYMPRLIDHLHYRIVDVSTVKELARRWYPRCLAGAPVKKMTHRALEDIKESITELRHYKKFFFLPLNDSSYSL